ncbi:Hypothetical predicted protein [Mytilus galloprovincialis]|uniref:TIR domain-containing protein n=1 Tax=Mytilus galloprovincialis TaxID=29158 RepID=A0A8B6HL74_MYTGA|nr:Hypothetical predicted protein [Mytilus galloprovincialis]
MFQIVLFHVILYWIVPPVQMDCSVSKRAFGVILADCRNQHLTQIPQHLPQDLNILDLSENYIDTINSSVLSKYKLLSTVFINKNKLRSLDFIDFAGLPLLTRFEATGNLLNLTDSYSASIPLLMLTQLDIGQNMKKTNCDESTEISYNIPVEHLTKLRGLTLDLVCFPYFPNQFRAMIKLTNIRFKNCFINYLTNDTFRNLPGHITELYMNDCSYFFVVEINALIHFPKLRVLDVSKSPIHLVQAFRMLYPFENQTMDIINFHDVTFPKVKTFYYDVVLTEEMMSYIKTMCIKTLDISFNNIVAFRNNSLLAFEHPECFERLHLTANNFSFKYFIEEFMEFFKRLTNLEIYDHSYFALGYRNPKFYNDTTSTIDDAITLNSNLMPKKVVLYAPKSLKEFRASHIMAKFLFDEVVFNQSSLEKFDVSDFDTIIFPKFTFIGKIRVKSLDISGINADKTLDKFPLMSCLTTLKMSKAKLFKVFNDSHSPFGIFNWAPNVENLDLSKNFMWVLNKRFLDGLKHLKYLNLHDNFFQTVPEVLTSLTNINEIDLSANSLPTLDGNIREWIDTQQKKLGKFKVSLVFNPFLCHCETVSFLYWIRSTDAILDCDGNYTCRLDTNHISNTLTVYDKIHDYYSDCNGILWLKFGVSLLTCIIILTIFATLLYNFRWRIVFFCQRKFLKMAEKSLNVDYKYDVYVSYSDDGAYFIKNILQPKIEQEWGLTMCCEDRDFFIGDSIVDARTVSIHESRHIIFIVTPSFREREWSSFEIERAKYEKFSRDLQKIIVIAKGIATKDMPSEFATVWKDVSLIEWPIDVEGINMSWQKLRLSFFY